jgi:RNA polymerase II subunit A-like phosphatase
LVVDLDQTVLHATIDPSMGKLVGQPDLEIYPVVLPESPDQIYYIKLRPHLREFMMSMASLFELHVYTMGSRSYAQTVVQLFDPDGRLFYDRILSRDDSGISEQRKDLKRIFPAGDSSVLVIDDRADIWNYSRNLVPVPPCRVNVFD